MIIYRGWGGMGIVLPVLGAGIMLAIASSLKLPSAMFLKFALVGGFLGAVGAWFLGRWLNQKRPFVKLEEWKAQRRVELCSLVDQGQFQIAPGAPAPTSKVEGYAQVEELLEREARDLSPRMLNQHSLYGVPLHMVGLGIGVLILGGFVASFFTS